MRRVECPNCERLYEVEGTIRICPRCGFCLICVHQTAFNNMQSRTWRSCPFPHHEPNLSFKADAQLQASHLLEVLCDRIDIINQGRLIVLDTVDEIIVRTGTRTLEEAFIAITGGVEERELLAWREQKGAPA